MKKLALSQIRLGFVGFVLLAWVLLSFPSSSSVQQWVRAYSGAFQDRVYSIQQTRDGGYIVAGYYTFPTNAGRSDFWVLKLDENGNVLWQKTYGGFFDDIAYSIQQTRDGGYIVAGYTKSFGSSFEGMSDFWVLKLDTNGNVVWQKTYGGKYNEVAYSIQQTSDGGYIVAGWTDSFGVGLSDVWVLKLDENGNVQWQRTYGEKGYDEAYSIQQTRDGGYIVAGKTSFTTGEGDNFWVLKLDANGNVLWQKTYGEMGDDRAYSVQQTQDGGYIVAGTKLYFSAGYFVESSKDAWVLKLDENGNIQWQKTYGGRSEDIAYSIQQTRDGGYIVAGYTKSFGAGQEDAWVLKLKANGSVEWQKTYGGRNENIAYSIQQTQDGGYIVAGWTASFNMASWDAWVLKLDENGNIAGCSAVSTSRATVNNTRVVGADTSRFYETIATLVKPKDTNATINTPTANTTEVCYAGTDIFKR